MKHKHAELMMMYAQDAMETDKPWERWEYKECGDDNWYGFEIGNITWQSGLEYRRKENRNNEYIIRIKSLENRVTLLEKIVNSLTKNDYYAELQRRSVGL